MVRAMVPVVVRFTAPQLCVVKSIAVVAICMRLRFAMARVAVGLQRRHKNAVRMPV